MNYGHQQHHAPLNVARIESQYDNTKQSFDIFAYIFSRLIRYPCSSCSFGCCSSYEICVSCCLRPQQRPLLERVLGRLGHNPKALQLFVLVRTQFDLCLAKCRTSSRSVRNENTYIDPENKYCFGDEEALANANNKKAAG